MKNTFVAIISVFIVFIIFQSARVKDIVPENSVLIEIAGQKILAELVVTDAARAQGLSGRASLGEDEGMLFVFDTPDKYPFWMKGMNFPIDIIWIGEDMKVVYIKKDARPELFPETYGPEENAKYVLEVVSGFAEKNDLKVGDEVLFTY